MKNLTTTNWVPVPGFEGFYEINPHGQVRSLYKNFKGRIISKHVCRGYVTVKLTKEHKGSTRNIHRLLAEAFIPNPQNKPMVNHKDGNKLNYSLDNLEWVTRSENMKHAVAMRLSTWTKKPVYDRCTNTYYPSIWKASVATGVKYSVLKTYLNGTRRNNSCFRLVL